MKLTVFNRKAYTESINKLKARNAPGYVIDAYKEGYVSAINKYYRMRLERLLKRTHVVKENIVDLKKVADNTSVEFIREAANNKDLDFIKAFFMMTNMDIMTGSKIPPNASSLIKQDIVKDFGLKDLFKKLR
jgi:hypothetical protein